MTVPQQAHLEISNQAVHYWASSPYLSATVRLRLARSHQDQYEWLDAEFANLRLCQSWLASNALGRWEEASESFRAAMEVSEQEDPQVHARAQLARGRLQFNQGAYETAFETMRKAETYLTQTTDDEGLMTVRGEMAAYHLNKGDLDKALALYLEIDRRRQSTGVPEPSDHTLLMLGVVYRKKKDYERAADLVAQAMVKRENCSL
jgi:tetratricopeptide (TPR) repeat protein